MKKFFLVLIGIVILKWSICLAQTTNIQFKWNASSHPDIAGYMLYQAVEKGVYNYDYPIKVIDSKDTNTIISDISNGVYYWVLRSYDNQKRFSEDSNEIMTNINYDACPEAPTGFMVIKIERN